MQVNLEQLSSASLNQAGANHLLLTVGHSPTLFWLIGTPDQPFAVFLTGGYATHALAAGTAENWAGVSIGPVEVRVDPGSANAGESDTKLQLRASGGVLAFPASMKPHGFTETVWLPIIELRTTEGQAVYFSRWSIGLPGRTRAEWVELVRIHDGKLTTDLLSKS